MPIGSFFKDVGSKGGFAAGGESIFNGLNPAALAGQALLAIYSGYRQRKALKKQRQEATAIHVALPDQIAAVSMVYGRFKSKATPIDTIVSGRYSFAAPAAGAGVFKAQRYEQPGADGDARRSATNSATAGMDQSFELSSSDAVNPFLFCRWSGPVGPINRVWWINLNGTNHDFATWSTGQRIHVNHMGGADPMATANGYPASDKFTERVNVTGVFRNTDLRPYGEERIPFDLDLYGEGRLIRTFMADGTLSAVLSYSNNPIEVAIDYMTDPVYGWGLPDSMLNLASAKAAADVCGRFVDTLPGNEDFVLTRRGAVWQRPGEWDDDAPYYKWNQAAGRVGFGNFPTIQGARTLARVDRSDSVLGGKDIAVPVFPVDDRRGWGAYLQDGEQHEFVWNNRILTHADVSTDAPRTTPTPATSAGGYDATKATTCFPPQLSKNPAHANGPPTSDAARIRLYEFNGELDTTQTLRRNLFSTFDVVSGMRVFWWNGEIWFSVVNPTTAAEEDALVEATWNDAHFFGGVTTSVPERISEYVADFADEAKDFESSRAVWPEPGSADHAEIEAVLGPKPHGRAGTYVGLSTIHHGNALSEYEVRTRLRAVEHGFQVHRSEWNANRVLPGALIDISSEVSGVESTRCIVDSVEIQDRFVGFTVVKFDYRDLAWNKNQPIAQAYGGNVDVPVNIAAPDTVVATFDPSARQFDIAWTLPAGEPQAAFADLRARVNGGPWLAIASVVGGNRTFLWPANDAGGNYEFGVRQRQSDHSTSAYTDSAAIPVVAVTPTLASSALPPPNDFCWDYKNIGQISVDGGYNLQDHNVFLVRAASDIGLLHKRFTAAQIAAGVEEPSGSVALPAGWVDLGTGPIDLDDVPDATPGEQGTVYEILYWFGPYTSSYTFFDGDDIKPRPVPDLPAGSEWVVRNIYQATDGESSVPTGGTDDGTDYVAPTSWSEAFQVPGNNELAFGTLIRYRKNAGVDWAQVQGRGSYRRKTLAGDWYALTQKADTIRLGRHDANGVDLLFPMQDLVTALDVGAPVHMSLVYADDRWIEWRVESHSSYWIGNPLDASGLWLTLRSPPTANSAGGDAAIGSGDVPVRICWRYSGEVQAALDAIHRSALANIVPVILDDAAFTAGVTNLIGDVTDDVLTGPEIKVLYENEDDTNAFTDASKAKLTGLDAAAEQNVKSDWDATTGDAEILNKPTIPDEAGAATESTAGRWRARSAQAAAASGSTSWTGRLRALVTRPCRP